jgi:hypothetical protein
MLGSAVGLLTVVIAQAVGLTINWHLCRGVLRLARGVGQQWHRSATDPEGSC